MKDKIEEKILFSQLRGGNKKLFIKVYDLYVDQIYRFIYFKVSSKEEAEDLTSAVFLKIWSYIQDGNLINHKTLQSLIYTIARNSVIDYYRKINRQQDVVINYDAQNNQEIADGRQDTHKKIENEFDFAAIQKKLLELKDEYREIIVLRYINELSIAEIAEVLNKPKGNVRVLIYRAIKALRGLADKQD